MNEIRCLSPSESQQTNRFYAKTIPIPTSVIVLSSWVVCRVSGLSSRSVRFLIGLEKSGYSIWISIPFRTELCPLIFESCPWLVNQLLYPPKTYHLPEKSETNIIRIGDTILNQFRRLRLLQTGNATDVEMTIVTNFECEIENSCNVETDLQAANIESPVVWSKWHAYLE